MLLIHCPYCDEDLPELEFTYAGEAHIDRPADPASLDDEAWRDYLFIRSNVKGPHYERWRHNHGCARFFNAVRDTVSDRFLTTYRVGDPRPDLASLTGKEGKE
ncbi:sarcosine oxidase subunit delta [Fodinicurvata sediminis]|uniref:sarcosine oxidase subunit delta n=1 Tax=Fodinicurvata sediminis TaxID=1121832 RepID=UPI0003B694F5|nr:sarcosine oxidase subunit delta [Fodinicurvata sediminis]